MCKKYTVGKCTVLDLECIQQSVFKFLIYSHYALNVQKHSYYVYLQKTKKKKNSWYPVRESKKTTEKIFHVPAERGNNIKPIEMDMEYHKLLNRHGSTRKANNRLNTRNWGALVQITNRLNFYNTVAKKCTNLC